MMLINVLKIMFFHNRSGIRFIITRKEGIYNGSPIEGHEDGGWRNIPFSRNSSHEVSLNQGTTVFDDADCIKFGLSMFRRCSAKRQLNDRIKYFRLLSSLFLHRGILHEQRFNAAPKIIQWRSSNEEVLFEQFRCNVHILICCMGSVPLLF